MSDLPIACSLDGASLQQRIAELRALGNEHLCGAERRDGTWRLSFDVEARDRVERAAALERECCPFLDLAVEPGEGEVVLSIGAPPDAAPVADDLAAALGAER